MASFISKKLSLVLLLCSWCAALGIIFLLNYALAGPKLSPVYDTLLGFRSPPPVSQEILLIETDELIEPADVFTVLMALSEMGASDLLIEVPLLGSGSGMAESGLEFSYRINDEFDLLGRNIRSLFEAIRMGLVAPAESPAYVENLVELTERGRDRLNATIIRQDETGSVLAAQAEAVFGRAVTALDLRPAPTEDIPWYSRPRRDRDGALRRIAPAEHIVYRVLGPRWETSTVELTEAGPVLVNTFENQGERIQFRFPLDRDGNILIEKQRPTKEHSFRRLTLKHFRNYDQTGKLLARLLKDSEALGVYAETMPERIPLILFDYAENLKEDLLKSPSEHGYTAWVDARAQYIAGLDEFLNGPAEATLVNGYEKLIATEKLDEQGIAKLRALRDELIQAFAGMREMYREFMELRNALAREINASLCIMGPEGSDIPEASALLANTLLTGYSITPGETLYIVIWSVAASFFILACIHALGSVWLLILGLALSLLCTVAFGSSFVISGYWIDPFIPAAACLGGTLFLAVSRFCIGYGRKLRFRLAYAGVVNGDMLGRMLKLGRPRLSEILCTQAVIIAVKNSGMSGKEDRETALEAAGIAEEFRQEFSRMFKQRGALILGFENDIALACFGSPPELLCREEMVHPVTKAVQCVRAILNNPLAAEWRIGIESGECAFSWSGETGYTAKGRPAVRARIFASLALRYEVKAVIGESAKIDGGLRARKLAALSGENFYELVI